MNKVGRAEWNRGGEGREAAEAAAGGGCTARLGSAARWSPRGEVGRWPWKHEVQAGYGRTRMREREPG
ncbi:hypothetical protein NL676_010017 [Syzygium grande]|nr:hypothetical protein NL676_010017 [Syzygium grande]